MSEAPVARVADTLSRTRLAASATLRRRDARLVFVGTTLGYLGLYLYALGHLAPGVGEFDVVVARDPVGRFFQTGVGPFSFEPVASVSLGPVTYLFSFNTVLGLVLASLVGVNLALTYLAWTQPKACGLGSSSTGILAGLPALLSGAACCGPVILIVVGIQATGVLLTAFDFLLPAAFVLLLGSLVLVGRQVDPTLV